MSAKQETLVKRKIIFSKIFFPLEWHALDESTQNKIELLDQLLRQLFEKSPSTHEDLKQFRFQPNKPVHLRKEIRRHIANQRKSQRFEMGREHAIVKHMLKNNTVTLDGSLYDAAKAIRSALFNTTEPKRTIDLTFIYLGWLRIRPPIFSEPVYQPLSVEESKPALFAAITHYLVLLTAHPFTDGNGRTSRILFNYILAKQYGNANHYFPIAELVRAAMGVHEEVLLRAHLSGNYMEFVLHFLELIESYLTFQSGVKRVSSDMATVINLAQISTSANAIGDARTMSPYMVSVLNVVQELDNQAINRSFVENIIEIYKELDTFCNPVFAVVSFSDLQKVSAKKVVQVTFFIENSGREQLVIRSRVLIEKFRFTIGLNFSVITGDHILDAKLLGHTILLYEGKSSIEDGISVILHEFDMV